MASRQAQVVTCDNWAEFGKIIAVLFSIAGGVFLLYLLFIAPIIRHNEVIFKLDVQQNELANQERTLRYLANK